jgi:ComF family protein
VYDERAALLVHALKYHERPDLADALGPELGRAAPPAPRADLVLSVPLHDARRRERGYNQSALLAEALGLALEVPHVEGILERVRPTRPQARLDPAARRANLSGAFRVRRPEWVKGRQILLVDDVMTTGATFEAAFDVLRLAGASATGVALAWAQ